MCPQQAHCSRHRPGNAACTRPSHDEDGIHRGQTIRVLIKQQLPASLPWVDRCNMKALSLLLTVSKDVTSKRVLPFVRLVPLRLLPFHWPAQHVSDGLVCFSIFTECYSLYYRDCRQVKTAALSPFDIPVPRIRQRRFTDGIIAVIKKAGEFHSRFTSSAPAAQLRE